MTFADALMPTTSELVRALSHELNRSAKQKIAEKGTKPHKCAWCHGTGHICVECGLSQCQCQPRQVGPCPECAGTGRG